MTRIALVRHGQTDWNLHGRIQGSSDIPLNDTGRAQARGAGADLAELGRDPQLGIRWDALYASPLERAVETAALLGEHLDSPFTRADIGRLPGIAERSYGPAEGMKADDIRARYGSVEQVPGAESREAVIERAVPELLALGAAHRENASVIVVSHGGVIGSLIRYATDWQLPRPGEFVANGTFYLFRVADGRLRLESYLNDPEALAGLSDPAAADLPS